MESFDRMFTSALRNFDAGLQQAIYYALFIDIVLLIALGVFIWCCCVYVLNYKKFVQENVRVKKSERLYYIARAERERLEMKKIKLEVGFAENVDDFISQVDLK